MWKYISPANPATIKNDLLFINTIKKEKFDIATKLFEENLISDDYVTCSTPAFIIYLIENNNVTCMRRIFKLEHETFKFIFRNLSNMIIDCDNDVTALAIEMGLIKKIES